MRVDANPNANLNAIQSLPADHSGGLHPFAFDADPCADQHRAVAADAYTAANACADDRTFAD